MLADLADVVTNMGLRSGLTRTRGQEIGEDPPESFCHLLDRVDRVDGNGAGGPV